MKYPKDRGITILEKVDQSVKKQHIFTISLFNILDKEPTVLDTKIALVTVASKLIEMLLEKMAHIELVCIRI